MKVNRVSCLEQNGFCIVPFFHEEVVDKLRDLLTFDDNAPTPNRRLFGEMWSRVANVALHGGMRLFLSSFTPVAGKGPHVRCVRAILFDKTPDANWKVPWHQDLTIAVEKRVDLPGYTAWTEKEGIPHVQPPVAVLENMLTARIHLDPCGSDNGALKVLPCTHLDGRLTSDAIGARRTAIEEYTCACKVGDVLFMRPLLLHASSPAATPSRRRVLHLEFAGCDLHNPLRWQEF